MSVSRCILHPIDTLMYSSEPIPGRQNLDVQLSAVRVPQWPCCVGLWTKLPLWCFEAVSNLKKSAFKCHESIQIASCVKPCCLIAVVLTKSPKLSVLGIPRQGD